MTHRLVIALGMDGPGIGLTGRRVDDAEYDVEMLGRERNRRQGLRALENAIEKVPSQLEFVVSVSAHVDRSYGSPFATGVVDGKDLDVG
jgi:hypothetical protein